tara:strand:+ start:1270 stop:2538 length:1269 start_codon:yes stop_codon:yes gene_type:complete
MTEFSPSQQEDMLAAKAAKMATTAAQREAAFANTSPAPTFGFGIVKSCGDSEKSGKLLILSDIFGPTPVACSYVSPVGGGGAGLFALPGVGATVLCAQIPSTNPPVQNVWMGCLYKAGQVVPDSYISQPYARTEREVAKNYTEEMPAPRGTAGGATVGAGVPNQEVIYVDNDLPNSYVFQHPAGHMLRMTKKVTEFRNQNEVVLRSAMGKRLVLSDAPAKNGGNALQLLDEDNNGVSIYTQSTAPTIALETKGDIVQTSREGNLTSTISANSKDKAATITNASQNGHIGVSAVGEQSTIDLYATDRLTLQVGSTQLILTNEGLTINAQSVNITGGGNSDIVLGGTSLGNHTHLANINIPPGAIQVTSTGTGTATYSGDLVTGVPATTVASTGVQSAGYTAQGITTTAISSDGSTEPLYPDVT